MELRFQTLDLEVQLIRCHFVVPDVAPVGEVDLLICVQRQGSAVKVERLSEHDV